jgi:hypothetical protein
MFVPGRPALKYGDLMLQQAATDFGQASGQQDSRGERAARRFIFPSPASPFPPHAPLPPAPVLLPCLHHPPSPKLTNFAPSAGAWIS